MKPSAFLSGLDGPEGDFAADAANARETVLSFEETRASDFAKSIAGDFNPLHDVGHSRFCIPGDLLFAALVSRYGLHAETNVNFANMLPARATVRLPAQFEGKLLLLDDRDREVLGWFHAGAAVPGGEFARCLVLEYVRFSGKTFPSILVPMMREANAMVHPTRPLVIYKDMAIRLDADLVAQGLDDGCDVALLPGKHSLSVTGKKGAARLQFSISLNGTIVGNGEKHFVLGGLRDFDQEAIDGLVSEYEGRKAAWAAPGGNIPA